MPQPFNKKSQSVLRKAQQLGESSDGVVTPMHVLSALLDVVPDIWSDWPDVDVEGIRSAAQLPVTEETSSERSNAVLANSVKRVLAYAMEERFRARRDENVRHFPWSNEFVEPQFILLGLLREVDSDAAQLLTSRGLTLEKGRRYLTA